jgi:preprotein translocase subunit SecD
VLINERIREEPVPQDGPRRRRGGLRAAFFAIVDTHVTTFLSTDPVGWSGP